MMRRARFKRRFLPARSKRQSAKEKGLRRRMATDRAELDEILQANLENIRVDFYRGERIMLLHAIVICGRHGIILPPWIVDEVRTAWNRYIGAEAWTLDEAFGVRRPKGQHRTAGPGVS